MTDFRAKGTIMGLAGLTAVFGMGRGGTPPVWSPEKRPAGGEAGRARFRGGLVTRGGEGARSVMGGARTRVSVSTKVDPLRGNRTSSRLVGSWCARDPVVAWGWWSGRRTDRGGQAIGC